MIKLGSTVKDPETGFFGKVTARCEYLYGKPKILVENIDTTNRPIEWWYEEERLIEMEDK